MSKLDGLVDDIYGVLQREVPLNDEQVDSLSKRLAKTIKDRLGTRKGPRPALSMSSFGAKCLRKLWYKEHMPDKAEPVRPNILLKWIYGAIIEDLILGLASAAGRKVEGEQDTLSLHGVLGHRDAVVDGITVDVKSANGRSFEKFKNHSLATDDPFGYIDQISLYTLAANEDPIVVDKTTAAFIAVDQEMGHIVVDEYPIKDRGYDELARSARSALESTKAPERGFDPVPDGKSGNEVLCLECRYCEFKTTCWSDSNGGKGLRKFLYSNGPRWFTKVVREPDVLEVSNN